MLVMCDGGTLSKLISDFNYVGVVLIVTIKWEKQRHFDVLSIYDITNYCANVWIKWINFKFWISQQRNKLQDKRGTIVFLIACSMKLSLET